LTSAVARIQVSHFKETFRIRALEWLMTLAVLGWGIGLFYTDAAYIKPFFGVMFVVISPWAMASIMTVIGLSRFCALLINGFWRRTPLIRWFMAVCTAFIWMQMAVALVTSKIFTPGWLIYTLFVVAEMCNSYYASADIRAVAEEEKIKRSEPGGNGP
jgi:hypothetical protein